ncbi:MAG: DUF6443 domain-containing protein [Taibaiella sp.]|jgi:RHS repeat-associated protein
MQHHIRYFLFFIIAGSLPLVTLAQPTPNPQDNTPSSIPSIPPVGAYPGLTDMSTSLKKNYIRSIRPDMRTSIWPPNSSSGSYNRQVTQYFDGLGRPLQTVNKRAHFEGYDIVQQHVYDEAGRETYKYLPFAVPEAVSTGNICFPAKTRLEDFYSGTPGEEPFSKTEFDNSPLNRITKQMAPGHSWVGSSRGVTNALLFNQLSENVRVWSVPASGLPTTGSAYSDGDLYVSKTTDEDGKTVIEYKNKSGQVVLHKTQVSENPGSSHTGYACTYYVYDDLARLRYVIPPKAVETIEGLSWNLSSVTELCYSYTYNTKGLLTSKKIPGKGAETFYYDARNRQILYQDAKLSAQGKWQFTIYDALNRPLITGIFTTSFNTSNFNDILYGPSSPPSTNIFSFFKNYNLWHQYPTSIDGCVILSYNYYDNYTDGGLASTFAYDVTQLGTIYASVFLDYPSLSKNVQGLLAGNKVKILDPDNPNAGWITSVNYYDEKGRVIQSQSINHLGGAEVSSNLYYVHGMLRRNVLRHFNPLVQAVPNANDLLEEIKIDRTYENKIGNGGSGLTWHISQSINNGIYYDLAFYQHDHLGRITTKEFPAGVVLQEYNTRGFLNHIEYENFNQAQTAPHRFEENLYYDNGFKSQYYSGNIAGITWSGSDGIPKSYGYSYDKLNRLTHAEFRRNDGSGWQNTDYDYTASNITYDPNGNLQSMNQMVPVATPGAPAMLMDGLTYNYAPNTNKLIKVTDNVPAANTAVFPDFKDEANFNEEYAYDGNGNMITDKNKHISSITYNFFNKPEKIVVDGKGTITYIYDATGKRLQKRIDSTSANPGPDEVYDYIGNFVYKNNVLQYITNEEGRARPVANQETNFNTKFVYDYFIKDHLGNVRSTVTATPMNANYLARHELSAANIEQLVFDNIANVRDGKPGSTDPNDGMAARLSGSIPDKRVGTAIMLRTMPGDRFNISVDAYYEGQFTQDDGVGTESVISSLLSALTGGINYDGVPLSELPENVRTINSALTNPQLAAQLDNLVSSNNNPNAPKAHLNYLFFNNKLELIPGKSGAVQVPVNPGGWLPISPATGGVFGQAQTDEPGYVIIYIDNQSLGKDVWFDNLTVGHYTSDVIEENHYYPFGLTLATAEAPNVTRNPLKFNTKELEKRFGLEMYDFGARMQDPQLGIWHAPDMMAEKFYHESPYNYAGNNPVRNIDIGGLLKASYNSGALKEYGVTNADIKMFETIVNNVGNLVRNNPQALEAIANTTGFSKDRILSEFQAGQGPEVRLVPMGGGARGTMSGITLDPSVMTYLRGLDPADKEAYNEQLLGIAMSLIHEYGHYGDQTTNDGNNSGQYEVGERDNSAGGKTTFRKSYKEIFGGNNIDKGKQKYTLSPTGHRGTDIEVIGFGVTGDIDNKGKASVYPRTEYSEIIDSKDLPTPPKQLPNEAADDNIRKSLGVK